VDPHDKHEPIKADWAAKVGVVLSGLVLLLGGFTSLINLRFDVEYLKNWKQEVDGNRFTSKDGESLALQLRKEIELERASAQDLCKEVVRLARELGRIPGNDCKRP
jgi:hypothetical protein